MKEAKARLIVELDGGGHYTIEQIEKDNIRTKESESKNSLPQSALLTAPSSEGAFWAKIAKSFTLSLSQLR